LGCACPARELCGSAPVTLLARRRRKTGNGGGAFEDPELQGKVAVVTGSSRGIGLETATRLANNGASVGIVARAHQAVDDAVGSIQAAGGRAVGVPADATSLEATERVRERIESGLGAVDSSPPSPAAEVPDRPGARAQRGGVALHRRRQPDRDVPDVEDVPARDDRAARRIDHDDGLVGGSYADAGRSGACAAAKASIVMLTRHVASQVGQYGVRVNCLSPSTVLTERTGRQMPDEVKERFTTLHPLGRLGEPRDVAEAACFLASDKASWLTGVVLDVAGGAVMV
jgi:3-oxoacyl-[acyl-carrier protein] reductase